MGGGVTGGGRTVVVEDEREVGVQTRINGHVTDSIEISPSPAAPSARAMSSLAK